MIRFHQDRDEMVSMLKYPAGASNLIPYWRAEVDSDFHPSEIHKIMPAGTK